MKKRIVIIGLRGQTTSAWQLPIESAAQGLVYPASERGNSISVMDVSNGYVKSIVTNIRRMTIGRALWE